MVNYESAQAYCNEEWGGATLPIIHSQAEQDYLADLLFSKPDWLREPRGSAGRYGQYRAARLHRPSLSELLPAGKFENALGGDGFGRSDFRSKLREHFEINRHYIVVAALKSLADEGRIAAATVADAIAKYGINANKINPLYA